MNKINKVFADYMPILIGRGEAIPLKCGKAIKNMPSVYPKSDNAVLEDIKSEIEKDSLSDVNGSKFIFVKRVYEILDKHICGKENT